MQFGGPFFVLAIIAMSYSAWLITSWIRAKHGYPIENEWGGSVQPLGVGDDETMQTLKAENEQLRGTVGKLEDRLKVLERIATDPTKRLSDEIDNLR
jgi:hypothetical protein